MFSSVGCFFYLTHPTKLLKHSLHISHCIPPSFKDSSSSYTLSYYYKNEYVHDSMSLDLGGIRTAIGSMKTPMSPETSLTSSCHRSEGKHGLIFFFSFLLGSSVMTSAKADLSMELNTLNYEK